MYHVLSTDDFERETVIELMKSAESIRSTSRRELRGRLQGALVATLFYEPSTRTRLSFEAALTRLGGRVVGAENARENSSAKKGETLEDVFRVVGAYVDAIVIRHHETDALANAAKLSPVPIINAGAGAGEHPTQALLDVYTLWREFGRVDGLKVAMIGDLKYGRTVHSLLKMLALFNGVEVTLTSPDALRLPEALGQELEGRGLKLHTENSMERVLSSSDAVYQTRIQMERLGSPLEVQDAKAFAIHTNHLAFMRPESRILHPLPRVDEIDVGVDADERAAYFRQVENGLYMRMALLQEILGGILD